MNKARRVKELETEITRHEQQLAELNAQLADPIVAADYVKTAAVLAEIEQANAELETLGAEWEQLLE